VDGVVLADTTVLIDNLRNHPAASAALDDLVDNGGGLAASVVTKVELLAGMRSHERRQTRALMDQIIWISALGPIAEKAGEYARKYRASHHNIGVPDFLIAATADHFELELWTRNVKHFPMFPKLKAPY
jgi:predicted nucleic acid-binding protein